MLFDVPSEIFGRRVIEFLDAGRREHGERIVYCIWERPPRHEAARDTRDATLCFRCHHRESSVNKILLAAFPVQAMPGYLAKVIARLNDNHG